MDFENVFSNGGQDYYIYLFFLYIIASVKKVR